jgi:Fe-S cluster biosynthesis and repair protein YggX
MVHCVKFDKDMPGLDRVPWRGEIGKRVYESVSKEAWKLWVEYSKMLMNEYRLNPIVPNSQKIMEEQMEQFFFGEGAKLPEGLHSPKAKAESTPFPLRDVPPESRRSLSSILRRRFAARSRPRPGFAPRKQKSAVPDPSGRGDVIRAIAR